MSSLNTISRKSSETTYGGAKVKRISPEEQLNRMVLANLLWEDSFYVDGKTTADIISELIPQVDPQIVATIALKARSQLKLRHVPLLLMRELARSGNMKAEDLAAVIQRPDEMGEFLSIYWKEGRTPISNQVRKGLASAFTKFNEYSLAKHDKNSALITIRDVMFLTHPTPETVAQEELFKRIANKAMTTPDTWETALSAGADKKETFTRLMYENNLGGLAFLCNLRNITECGINHTLVRAYAKTVDWSRVLPFRFVSAAAHVPMLEDMLEEAMFSALEGMPKLPGKTVLLVDISGSMFGGTVSKKSELTPFDAAASLAMLCREICEEVEIRSFSESLSSVLKPRRGFALREEIRNSQEISGTNLVRAVYSLNHISEYDRCILFTDEQHNSDYNDTIMPAPKGKGYILNVASYKNGVNHSEWTTITGFSESTIRYIQEIEK